MTKLLRCNFQAQMARMVIGMFREAIEEFDSYHKRLIKSNVEGFHPALTAECLKRIKQLQHIFTKIMTMEQEAVSLHQELSVSCMLDFDQNVTMDESAKDVLKQRRYELGKRIGAIVSEVEILTESFYYTAGRLVNIISHKTNPVLMGRFKRLGVTIVRNHLIVHPEGENSQIFNLSFAMGSSRGPIIKPTRPESERGRHEDKGLVDNAEELNEKLLQKIREASSKLDAV